MKRTTAKKARKSPKKAQRKRVAPTSEHTPDPIFKLIEDWKAAEADYDMEDIIFTCH